MKTIKTTVGYLVNKDLSSKLEQGQTLAQIEDMSQNNIEVYCLEFRLKYSSQLKSYKDGTVNRYVERFIKASKQVTA